ncbi:hypothetical protein RQP46_011421 [Phenoliferia psychrophenolica]
MATTEDTPLPAYSKPGSGVIHYHSRHLLVALSSANAVQSGGLGLAFLPGAHLRIAISHADTSHSLSSAFSAIVVQFVGTSSVDAPGGKGKHGARKMADVITEIPLNKESSTSSWITEIEIPEKADCVCEWLAREASDSDQSNTPTTVTLPPSVNIVEDLSKRKRTGGSLVVDYRVKLTLPKLDGGFVYDSDDIRSLGRKPWRTMLLDSPDAAFKIGSTRSSITQLKQADDYVVLWQLAVTFEGSLKDQHPEFSSLVLSSAWTKVSIGRRFRRRDTATSPPPSSDLFTNVHAAALENPPNVEEIEHIGGSSSSCIVRFKGLLKVHKDAIPISNTCDGDLEVMVIASLESPRVENAVTSMVSMFPGLDEPPPSYPSLDFYPLGANSEYVGINAM